MDNHKNRQDDDAQEQELFSRLEIPYSKSKEEVWKTITEKISEQPKAKTVNLFPTTWMKWTAAASVALLLSFGIFARYYTTNIVLGAGEFANHTLPDGSTVYLNAGTSLSYAPYWWSFNRAVDMQGEAFFEVAKGKRFVVYSEQGATEVLGTKFNIYARENSYQVHCVTGKVKVSKEENNQAILTPGESAYLDEKGLVRETNALSQAEAMPWRLNKFLYNTTPLSKVIADIERHYNVKINIKTGNISKEHYTGLFNRDVSVEEALEIICYSFGWKFEHQKNNVYLIKARD